MEYRSLILKNSNDNLFPIQTSFDPFKDYNEMMEIFLEQKRNQYSLKEEFEKIEKDSEAYDYPVKNDYLNHFSMEAIDYHHQLQITYPNTFRCTFISQVASFIEYEIRAICNYYSFKKNLGISTNDYQGSEFDKFKLMLKDTAKINVNDLNPEWPILKAFWFLRNRITHHQGQISLNDFKKKLNLIHEFMEYQEFSNSETGRIFIPDKEAANKFINTSISFFEKLLSSLNL